MSGTSSSMTSAQFAPAASGVKTGVVGADMERCLVRGGGRPFTIILRRGMWLCVRACVRAMLPMGPAYAERLAGLRPQGMQCRDSTDSAAHQIGGRAMTF